MPVKSESMAGGRGAAAVPCLRELRTIFLVACLNFSLLAAAQATTSWKLSAGSPNARGLFVFNLCSRAVENIVQRFLFKTWSQFIPCKLSATGLEFIPLTGNTTE